MHSQSFHLVIPALSRNVSNITDASTLRFVIVFCWFVLGNAILRSVLPRVWRSCILCVRGLMFLVKGPEMITKAYNLAHGRSFSLPTPNGQYHFVSSRNHVKELSQARSNTLSLHAVSLEILQPKHTMCGIEWKDQRGIDGVAFVKVLKADLTSHLPFFLPRLSAMMEARMDKTFDESTLQNGACKVSVKSFVEHLVTKANCTVFFGEELANDPVFFEAALHFPDDAIIAGECLRLMPRGIGQLVARLVTGGYHSSKALFGILEPLVEKRMKLRELELDGHPWQNKPVDCMQWLIDTSPRKNPWTTKRTVGEIIATWLGSVHLLSLTAIYTVEDLCMHPEYVECLRQEIAACPKGEWIDKLSKDEGLPLLDSFVKESIRMNTCDAVSGRRKAIAPFQFSDGRRVAVGDWVSMPLKAIFEDPDHFEEPQTFNPRRFQSQSRLSDTEYPWMTWGSRMTCPGRVYAAAMLKLILSQFLARYDIELLDAKSHRSFTWRTAIIPRTDTTMLVRRSTYYEGAFGGN